MKRFLLALLFCGALESAANALPNVTEIIPAKGGAIRITPIYHGSLQFEYQGIVVHVDPFSAGNYSGAKKADYILVTHTHPDHMDIKALSKLCYANTEEDAGGTTKIFCPRSVAIQIKRLEVDFGSSVEVQVIEENDGSPVATWFEDGREFLIEAIPAYNIKRGPKPGQKFHPKGEFNGYILTLGGKRIYIAGDTEATPEMKALKNIDIAFLPMNLPYTMTPQEAAIGAKAFKPKVVYPYHYRYPFNKANDNPQQFAKAMAGSGVTVKLRNWYGHPAAK